MKKEEFELLQSYKKPMSRNKNFEHFSGESGKHIRALFARMESLKKELAYALSQKQLAARKEGDHIKTEISSDSISYKRVSLLNEYDILYVTSYDKRLKEFFDKIYEKR